MTDEKSVKQAIAELEAQGSDPMETESITIQLPSDTKRKLERMAAVSGHTRALPHGAGVVGNMSWACGEAFDFLFRHLDLYQEDKAEQLSKALES